MPVPMVCFGCGKYILELYEQYQVIRDEFKAEDEDPNSTDSTNSPDSPEFRALAELQIWKMCCRQYFLTIHNMDDYIL